MTAGNKITLLLLSMALGALGLLALGYGGGRDELRAPKIDTRLPVANPPADPNRPDLFEEPVIDKEQEIGSTVLSSGEPEH